MIGGWRNRIARVEITNEEFPVFKRQAYLADIQNQSHLTLEQFILQVLKILDGADFRIDLSGIGDVVTVRASFAAGLNRRSVDVRNSEFRQIVNENDGI